MPQREAVLKERGDGGGGLVRLVLVPPSDLSDTYTTPGQYAVVQAGGEKDAFLVLAGDPGSPTWELLVRPGGAAVTALLEKQEGSVVLVSAAQGRGFPMAEAAGRNLLVAVTGSGVAAARPVLRARVRSGEASKTELLFGVRTVADVALADEVASWEQSGIVVSVCLSREVPPPGQSRYVSGYVQDVARAHASRPGGATRENRLIFAAGVQPMIAGVRAVARELGVRESDIRTNY